MNLDRIDYGILNELQQNARLSNKDLAAANHISPSTCLERVRRLKTLGALRGFHADVEPGVLGITVQALIAARLDQHLHISFEQLRDDLLARPEVVAVYLIAGAQDFLMHVAVRDVAHLRDFVGGTLTSRRDIAHIETSLIFDYARSATLPNYGEK